MTTTASITFTTYHEDGCQNPAVAYEPRTLCPWCGGHSVAGLVDPPDYFHIEENGTVVEDNPAAVVAAREAVGPLPFCEACGADLSAGTHEPDCGNATYCAGCGVQFEDDTDEIEHECPAAVVVFPVSEAVPADDPFGWPS